MRFKYDCFNNRLSRLEDGYAREISEQQGFVSSYGEQGFVLGTNQPNHWISFTVYDRIVRAFYKRISRIDGNNVITYYQKDIPKEAVIEFEFTEADIVAKRDESRS
jgi:hypothetical protein